MLYTIRDIEYEDLIPNTHTHTNIINKFERFPSEILVSVGFRFMDISEKLINAAK